MATKADKPIKKYTWVPKVGKNVSNKYGAKGSYAAGHHTGTDIAAKEGAKIVWAKPNVGKVVESAYSKDYGNYVIIKDKLPKPNAIIAGDAPSNTDPAKNLGPGETLLAHLKNRGPKAGTKLQPGETIEHVGDTGNSTGPHLHIEQTAPGKQWAYNRVVKPQLVYAAPNGSAIMYRLNHVLGTSGDDALRQTVINYNNAGKGIRTFGKPGTSSYRIEILNGKDNWIKNPATVFDKLRAYAPAAAGQPNNQLPLPPTSVGAPAVAPPPTTDSGSGATPPQPPATDPPPVEPGSPPPDTTDPNTGDPTTTDPAADEATPDPAAEAGAGGTTGTPPTPDTADNAGATDPNLDTKPKGMVASKAYLKQQQRVAAHSNDVDISAAAIKSKSILVADRNNDGTVSKKEQRVLNPADSNNNGKVNTKEINKYVATVDLNKDNKVKPVEAKAFRTLDGNDNNNVSNKELAAAKAVAGKDGVTTREEAKKVLKAEIDSKKDQREHDYAAEFLRRTNEKQGGSQAVGEQASALAVSQTASRKKQDDDGSGKKKKNK